VRIRDAVLQVAGRLCKYALLATPTAKGFDAIEAPEQAPDEPKASIPARRLMWFGFRSVPPAGSECAVIASRAGASNNMIVGCENLGFGPVDLETGEAAVYSQFDQLIFLDKEGSITSTAAGSSIQQFKDGNIVLISKGGATLGMSDTAADSTFSDNLTITRNTTSGHYIGGGGTPTAVIGAALGAGGTVGVVGTDSGFTVTMNTDAMATATGTMCTVTYARAYATAPRGCVISPANDQATIAPMNGAVYVDASTGLNVKIETTGMPAVATEYRYSVVVIQ